MDEDQELQLSLEDLMEESVTHLTEEFYKKDFNFSYSSLSKLMWNPAIFHAMYILGIKEERQESHLVQGSLIHCLLLEPEMFPQKFIVSPDNLPTGNPRIVVDRVFKHHQELYKNGDHRENLEEFDGAILDVMKDMNYYQNLKTDQQRLDKIITDETKNYWKFLHLKKDKIIIDQESHTFCINAVELVKRNEKVCNLIGCGVTDFDQKDVYNELPIDCKIIDKPFGLKGIVDNLVIDHAAKVIRINDIKTTAKELKDFPETVEFYNYWLQAIIYNILVANQFKEQIELNNYKLEFHFIVIDKNFQVYPFLVSDATLTLWLARFFKLIDEAHWHYVNKSYELPYKFATGSVTL